MLHLGIFNQNDFILDIGAGDGFQANYMRSKGYNVVELDIENSNYKSSENKRVKYDGINIPFPSESVDKIYTSHVLEHIKRNELDKVLKEQSRVVKKGGHIIHILPSPVWRIASIALYYPKKLINLTDKFAIKQSRKDEHKNKSYKQDKKRNYRLFPSGHGENDNAIQEIRTFSIGYWKEILNSHGMEMVSINSSGTIYSGHRIFPWLNIKGRSIISKTIGPSSYVYTLRKSISQSLKS